MRSDAGAVEYVDIKAYSHSAGGFVDLKRCVMKNNFLFAKTEFYVVEGRGLCFVCVPVKGVLHSIVAKDLPTPETVSLFRREYVKRGIDADKIDEYLKDPEAYVLKHRR